MVDTADGPKQGVLEDQETTLAVSVATDPGVGTVAKTIEMKPTGGAGRPLTPHCRRIVAG